MKRSPLPRALLASVSLALLAAPASSTWSIVAVDTATGEVCIASATCLGGISLKDNLAAVRVGIGAGAAQSFIDTSGTNRRTIFLGLADGKSPAEILAELEATDPQHQTRQYGIVNMADDPVGFTGSNAEQAKRAVQGQIGTVRYAIQGNVLTGPGVVLRAEKTLIASTGDLGQRVMAAMQTARSLGGDGRCSCDANHPTQCGVPPPNFKTSATIGFIVLARTGDADGVCNAGAGCANGSYYMDLEVTPGAANVDAVGRLQLLYDVWRAGLAGRPDHLLSRATLGTSVLPADGTSRAAVRVELRDLDGVPLGAGGASLTVEPVDDGDPRLLRTGPVIDHGDGTYTFHVRAGKATGRERLAVVVDDGGVRAALYPYLEVELVPPAPLLPGFQQVATSEPVDAPFFIDLGREAAGEPYLLLGSAAGTSPGFALGDLVVPLNHDPWLAFTLEHPDSGRLPGSAGVLDSRGRASARLVAGAGQLDALAGAHLDWSVVLPGRGFASRPVGLDLAP